MDEEEETENAQSTKWYDDWYVVRRLVLGAVCPETAKHVARQGDFQRSSLLKPIINSMTIQKYQSSYHRTI